MPTVKLVDETTTDPRVRAVFDDIRATKKVDRVPNFWRALAAHPANLELCWTQAKAIMHRQAGSQDERNHRPGGVDHQQLPILHQRAHAGTAEAGPGCGILRRTARGWTQFLWG